MGKGDIDTLAVTELEDDNRLLPLREDDFELVLEITLDTVGRIVAELYADNVKVPLITDDTELVLDKSLVIENDGDFVLVIDP